MENQNQNQNEKRIFKVDRKIYDINKIRELYKNFSIDELEYEIIILQLNIHHSINQFNCIMDYYNEIEGIKNLQVKKLNFKGLYKNDVK